MLLSAAGTSPALDALAQKSGANVKLEAARRGRI
jgi:hypothetical protein